jgi:hypothetical protein
VIEAAMGVVHVCGVIWFVGGVPFEVFGLHF